MGLHLCGGGDGGKERRGLPPGAPHRGERPAGKRRAVGQVGVTVTLEKENLLVGRGENVTPASEVGQVNMLVEPTYQIVIPCKVHGALPPEAGMFCRSRRNIERWWETLR